MLRYHLLRFWINCPEIGPRNLYFFVKKKSSQTNEFSRASRAENHWREMVGREKAEGEQAMDELIRGCRNISVALKFLPLSNNWLGIIDNLEFLFLW